MNTVYAFCLSLVFIRFDSLQYANIQPHSTITPDPCTGPGNAVLVEQFFNLVFTEYHTHPPVCVCVQMCLDQPTYCYPNGCFKKASPVHKKREINVPNKVQPVQQVAQVQQDKSLPKTFVVDSKSNFVDDLIHEKTVEKTPLSSTNYRYASYNELHKDPFKNRYQSIFKYKKTPKVHLKYNVREQVNYRKSDLLKIDKIDMTKTKWPITINENKQYYLEHRGKKLDIGNNQFIMASTAPKSKYFKRELPKQFTSTENEFAEADNKTDEAMFSMSSLIEDLIENRFNLFSNDTDVGFNYMDYFRSNVTTADPKTIPDKRNSLSGNTMPTKNDTTYVLSLNNTSENMDVNMYREDDANEQVNKKVFYDMIASLSKQIDQNNNSSFEMMEQVVGHRIDDSVIEMETTSKIRTVLPITQESPENSSASVKETIPAETTTLSTETLTTEVKGPADVSTEKETKKRDYFLPLARKSHRRPLKVLNNRPK